MKIITIDDNDQKIQSSDIVQDLIEIDLSQDVVVCTPNSEDTQFNDVTFNGSGISAFNRFNIKYDKYANFTFCPRLKMSIPNGLYPNYLSKIPGLFVIKTDPTEFEGIEVNTPSHLLDKNPNMTCMASTMNYKCITKIEFTLHEYNRDMFIKYANEKFNSIQLVAQNNLVDVMFLKTFIGVESVLYNSFYIIRSSYIYNNFPNFGGFN